MNIRGWMKGPAGRWFPVVSGLAVGAVCHLVFFLFSLLQYGGVEYMGVRDDSVADLVASKFVDTILLLGLKLLAMQVAVGVVVGGLAGVWWLVLGGFRSRGFTRGGVLWRLAASVAGVHVLVMWYGMTMYPQAFLDAFYHSNWFLRAFQGIASHVLPLWFYRLIATAVMVSVPVMGGLWAWRVHGSEVERRRYLWGSLAVVSPVVMGMLLLVWGGVPDSWRFSAGGQQEKPNVLVLVADSLRPDYMEQSQGGGYSSIQAESVEFKDAWSVFPRTFPAWVSLLSGQSPGTHKIRHMFPQPEKLSHPYETLANLLKAEGYETAIFSDFAGDIFSRIDLGFDYVDVPNFNLKSNVELGVWKIQVHLIPYLLATGLAPRIPEVKAYERLPDPRWLSERYLGWLTQRDSSKPYLAVVFYSTTHFPYSAPYPYYRDALGHGYDGPHQFCKVGLGLKETTPEDEEQVRRIFGATVSAVDDEVARVREFLEGEGQWGNMVVVLTADHGENLYEHGRGNGHGDTLDGGESLRVPLLYRVPGVAAKVVWGAVSTIDIAPTLLGFLGMEVPEWMEGVNLATEAGFVPPEGRAVYSETGLLFVDPDTSLEGRSIRYGDLAAMFDYTSDTSEIFLQHRVEPDALLAKHHMIVRKGHKLVYVPSRQKVTLQCFDLRADPEESTPLDVQSTQGCRELVEPLYQHMLAGGGTRVGDFVLPR